MSPLYYSGLNLENLLKKEIWHVSRMLECNDLKIFGRVLQTPAEVLVNLCMTPDCGVDQGIRIAIDCLERLWAGVAQ